MGKGAVTYRSKPNNWQADKAELHLKQKVKIKHKALTVKGIELTVFSQDRCISSFRRECQTETSSKCF